MSATRERTRRVAGAWRSAGEGVAPVAGGLRRGVGRNWAWGRRHPRAALAAVLAGLALVLGCFWLWFRDSPLVAVSRVQVTGLYGPGVPQIKQALRGAAMRMTTLDVSMARLRAAVQPFPDVRTLTVSTQFPHGIVIHVAEQVPVARISVNGRPMGVSREGILLKATAGTGQLPLLAVGGLYGGTHVSGAGSAAVLAVLAAAPYGLLPHIQSAQETSQNGVVLRLRHGPQLRFGDASQLHDKWAAALAVLGSASSQGAQYIDVTDPGRPAAGAATPPAASTSTSSSAASSGAAASSTAASSGTTGTAAATGAAAGAPTAPTASSGTTGAAGAAGAGAAGAAGTTGAAAGGG